MGYAEGFLKGMTVPVLFVFFFPSDRPGVGASSRMVVFWTRSNLIGTPPMVNGSPSIYDPRSIHVTGRVGRVRSNKVIWYQSFLISGSICSTRAKTVGCSCW